MSGAWIEVELACAGPENQSAVFLTLPAGARVADAIAAAPTHALPPGGRDQDFSGRVGVFGQRCSLERELSPGDRVEFYRPLELDAKAARRQRARESRIKAAS